MKLICLPSLPLCSTFFPLKAVIKREKNRSSDPWVCPDKGVLELNGRQRSVSKTCQHENCPTNHSCVLRLFWSVVRANVQTVWKSAFFGSCPVNLPCQHGCLRIGAVGCIFQCRRQTKFILASDEEPGLYTINGHAFTCCCNHHASTLHLGPAK